MLPPLLPLPSSRLTLQGTLEAPLQGWLDPSRVTLQGAPKVRVDYRMPVGLSGFRDHGPLIARVCTRARLQQKQPEEEKPKRWSRTLVEREYRLLLNWERAARKGHDAPSTEESMFLRLRGEINRVLHSSMTTQDIEAEIVKRTLNTCCTVAQRKARNTSTSG